MLLLAGNLELPYNNNIFKMASAYPNQVQMDFTEKFCLIFLLSLFPFVINVLSKTANFQSTFLVKYGVPDPMVAFSHRYTNFNE